MRADDVRGEFGGRLGIANLARPLPDDLAGGITDFRVDADYTRRRCLKARLHYRHSDFEIPAGCGLDVDGAQVNPGPNLEFDTLPKAAGLDVPTLFAVGDFRVTDAFHSIRLRPRVHHAHRNLVFPRVHHGSDVKFKRDVAAFVRSNFYPVDVDRGEIIDRAKMQQDGLARRNCLQGYGTPVPGNAGVIPQVRKLGLPRGGNTCRAHMGSVCELLHIQGAGRVRQEMPVSVQ